MLSGAAFLILSLLIVAGIGWQLLAEQARQRAVIDRRLGLASAAVAQRRVVLAAPDVVAPLLAQAQIDVTTQALGIFGGVLVLAALVALLAAGPVAALAVIAGVPLGLLAWVRRRAQRRVEALIEALPYYIDAVRQMQAVGNSLAQALERALADAPAIVQAYIAPVARRLELGAPVADAMQMLAERLRVPEISMLAAAIRTNMRYGGSISAVLLNLANILRERIRIKRELKAAISEAKISGRVLIVMPLVAMALLVAMNPSYIDFFVNDPRGHRLAVVAVVLQGMGMLVMRRVMRLAF
ncbi:type II secretion system F family protein (plasmid) [Sphingobium sp. SJ10-10]|uniref:type II secretion system F family protein n=1 Tax=unclassified Sphingobium TaxID=2611147 RepID=UPI0007706CC8|nr:MULTISPECIES: type II secretion system F family protein [unclassified Sphingobium]AMK25170.1 type II secretion system F domain-containing protein [Sphingobium sp. TKS]MEC6698492.1 type II secretion system F family protein [Sphingobium sp. SJ10-10]